jgi:integrase
VNGVHKNSTKTGQDRLFELCPPALAVLARQLKLRERLVAEGRITHDRLFFRKNGDPIQNLIGVRSRWQVSLKRAGLRPRRPYCARHSSVSWNLMLGKNPLWVARQHGHSVRTMLEIYAAWAEGAVESDVALIEQAMGRMPKRQRPGGLLGGIRRLFTRSAASDIRVRTPRASVWHWICHQKRGRCS